MRWLAWCLVAGCVDIDQRQSVPMPDDLDEFAEDIQPVLSASCANPSCHGRPDRPLELFAVHQHRLDPDQVFSDAELSPDELAANVQRACSFLVGAITAESSLLVRKPLAPEAGGVTHGGGDQFTETSNRDYQLLVQWIESALEGP